MPRILIKIMYFFTMSVSRILRVKNEYFAFKMEVMFLANLILTAPSKLYIILPYLLLEVYDEHTEH